ncbi:CaiB/BaiF CoA transferase family protein [Cupriavidus basilensis]|uniref:CaiB/BaiF CoA transferase family protein n=1 Tax=Cupriavidus basilensis TaxID=68895 RepID=UPI001E4D8E5D|nr:CoA transferase [Cupriavidus basilensis]
MMSLPDSSSPGAGKALRGLRVLEFSAGSVAGQYGGQCLGDLGADVVRVDGAWTAGAACHAAFNRNKRSLSADPHTGEGRELLRRLCSRADVLIDALPAATLDGLGLGWPELSRAAPRLVYARVVPAVMPAGPAPQDAADLLAEAAGGYMGITGGRDGAPSRLGTSALEALAGVNCQSAILAALFQRAATGLGQHVSTSVLESEIAFLANAAVECLLGGPQPARWGSEHAQQVPYKAFRTADGWIVVAAGFQNLYAAFVQELGRPDLAADARFATMSGRVQNRAALYAALDAETARHGTGDLLRRLERSGVPCAPVNDLAQVFAHRQVRHRGMRVDLPGGRPGARAVLGPPARYSAFAVAEDWMAPPVAGEHTESVLQDWLAPADQVAPLVP